MSRRDKESEHEIEQVIAAYVAQNGVTNVRDIADVVSSQLGMTPSTATVSKILQRLGYLPHKQSPFIWRHNPPKA